MSAFIPLENFGYVIEDKLMGSADKWRAYAANDDRPSDEYLELINDHALRADMERAGYKLSVLRTRSQRALANHMWFFKFERSFYENKIAERRESFAVVREDAP